MTDDVLIRGADKIHIGDSKYLGIRAIEMQWFGDREEDEDDELETLATLAFSVNSVEYNKMAKLGLVESASSTEESDETTRLTFRTDRDLMDEGEEALAEEWEASLEDGTAELTVWVDLDYWEVAEVS